VTALEIAIGSHIRLRQMSTGDTDAVVAMRNRPEAARYLYQRAPLSAADHDRWLADVLAQGDVVTAMEHPDGTVIGSTSLYNFDAARSCAEYGRLCSASVGAHPLSILEGSYLLFRAAFEVAELRRIFSFIAAPNVRTQRHGETLGYKREGLLRQHWLHADGCDDVVVIGVLADEFAAARPAMEERLYGKDAMPEFTEAQRANIQRLFAGPRSTS